MRWFYDPRADYLYRDNYNLLIGLKWPEGQVKDLYAASIRYAGTKLPHHEAAAWAQWVLAYMVDSALGERSDETVH